MVPYCKILTILNYFYPHLVKITFKIQDSEVLFLTCSHNMCSEMHGGILLRLCLKDLGAIKKKLIRVRVRIIKRKVYIGICWSVCQDSQTTMCYRQLVQTAQVSQLLKVSTKKTLKQSSADLALYSCNFVGLRMDKIDAAVPEIPSFSPTNLPCQSLGPTLPIMQLDC